MEGASAVCLGTNGAYFEKDARLLLDELVSDNDE